MNQIIDKSSSQKDDDFSSETISDTLNLKNDKVKTSEFDNFPIVAVQDVDCQMECYNYDNGDSAGFELQKTASTITKTSNQNEDDSKKRSLK